MNPPYFDFFDKLIIGPSEEDVDNGLNFIKKEERVEIVKYFKTRKIWKN